MNKNVNDMSKKKLKVAVAFGSGGAKGFVHVGVIKAMDELGFKPDIVAGSSMGAIIGCCYALGVPTDEIEKRVVEITTGNVLDIKLPNSYGFVKGDKAEKVITTFLKKQDDDNTTWQFSDCKIPFGCVAVDLSEAKIVNLTSGDLIKSVRASFSINGVFMPVNIDGRNLTDGGMLCRVPINLAREMGADIVIGVDCIGPTEYENVDENKYLDTIVRIFSIMDYEISKYEIESADFLLSLSQPDVSMIRIKNVEEAIEFGYAEAMKNLPIFLKKIKRIKKSVK